MGFIFLVLYSHVSTSQCRIGRLQELGQLDLFDPLVQSKLHERYGENVPLEELMISPGAMSSSEQLIVVAEEDQP
jgi:hypothetical protein